MNKNTLFRFLFLFFIGGIGFNSFGQVAVDDAFPAEFGETTTFNILDNDGFQNGTNTTITRVTPAGGTAGGTVAFYGVFGNVSYTPTAAEVLNGGTKTIIYEVCNGVTCAIATITLTLTDPDTDGDGVTNARETLSFTSLTNACEYNDVDVNTTVTSSGDCDGDGVSDQQEATDGTGRRVACEYNENSIHLIVTSEEDCDGDGVSDKQEAIDKTSPKNGCNYLVASQTASGLAKSLAWKNADCDGDGENNSIDPEPLNPCIGGNTVDKTNELWKKADCDGDGVTNEKEDLDGTIYTDACDFKVASITVAQSTDWYNGDCDNDGINNGVEVGLDPLVPVDTDKDNIPDFRDADSDDDGIEDVIENDSNNDGNTLDDSDGDGVLDFRDLDSDNDGLSDAYEKDIDGNGKLDDTDKDKLPNFIDSDDDNDGILTIKEGTTGDCDGDGFLNYLDNNPCEIVVPKGFSPDGDGINDNFVIEGITLYEDASLIVFNRWGNTVYKSENGYKNDWDGKSTNGLKVGGETLPVGTYFYILDIGDGSDVQKGYIYLNK